MIFFIGFFIFMACLLVSIELFLSLAFLFIPTVLVFLVLMALGVAIAFWKVYLIVFVAVFIINLFRD